MGAQISAWGEGLSGDTMDARIWARASAAAERLWSPRLASGGGRADRADAASRLAAHICRLRDAGVAAGPIGPGFCKADLDPREEEERNTPLSGKSAWLRPARVEAT